MMNTDKEIRIDDITLPGKWKDWHLTGILGEGAYGRVYRAEDEAGHVAAIKIFRLPEGTKTPETELLPLLNDLPGIVRVEDYCIEESEGMLRMECLSSFSDWQRGHPLTQEEAVTLMIELCQALEVCEDQGIIHRDIKPGNILITEDGHARLGDFGVARIASPTDSAYSLAGTFRYMAPEVYHGETYDQRADLYSLGMVFYEIANHGRVPFEERGREEALKRRMDGLPLPGPAQASKEYAEILCRACAFDPEQRYGNALELREDLVSLQEGSYRAKTAPGKCHTDPGRIHTGRWLAAALAIIVMAILSIVAGQKVNAPIVARESCGYGVTWVLKKNGTLEIAGDGVMEPLLSEYDDSKYEKMLSHLDDIKRLEVKGNVRLINFTNVLMPNLEEAEFSEGLDRIVSQSFSDHKNLRSVIFHGKDVDLGENAFFGCGKLSEVVLPSGLTAIPDGCFGECESLEELTIPDTVTQVGDYAFFDTPWYEALRRSRDRLIVGDQVLVFWKGQEEELTISKETGISHIGGGAFEGSRLKKITMDDSVLSIGRRAFEDVPLEEVILPDHLSAIPDYSFLGCSKLKRVDLPDHLKGIGDHAFFSCSSLKEMSIPESLESIGWEAFEETPFKKMHTDEEGFTVIGHILQDYSGSDRSLKIPDSLGIRGISESFLEQDMRIRSVILPEGLEFIEDKSFFMCFALESITFPSSLKRIGKGAFSETMWLQKQKSREYIIVNDILLYCNTKDTAFVIPDDLPVRVIAGEAFQGELLEEITIPSGITEIDDDAFSMCSHLGKVHLPAEWTQEEIRRCFYQTPWYYLRK